MEVDISDPFEKEVTEKFVNIAGHEVRFYTARELFEDLKDTDGFMSGIPSPNVPLSFKDLLDDLVEKDILGFSYSAGFFVKDEEELFTIEKLNF